MYKQIQQQNTLYREFIIIADLATQYSRQRNYGNYRPSKVILLAAYYRSTSSIHLTIYYKASNTIFNR